jgi:hypothetical protein
LGAELDENDEAISLLGMLSRAPGKAKDAFWFKPDAVDEPAPKVLDRAKPALEQVAHPAEDLDEPRPVPTSPHLAAKRRILSAQEVQEIILQGLGQIPDFPKRGVAITVYGFQPWSAMLSFAPGSTSHKNAVIFREALTEIVQEMRTTVEIDINQGD